MSAHTDASRAIRAIPTREEIEALLSRCAIDDTDRKILRMRYIKKQEFGYIADTIGMSYSGTVRRHKIAIVKLAAAKMMQKQ